MNCYYQEEEKVDQICRDLKKGPSEEKDLGRKKLLKVRELIYRISSIALFVTLN